jgi:hypothetical protein
MQGYLSSPRFNFVVLALSSSLFYLRAPTGGGGAGFDEDGPDSWGEHPIPRTQPAGYLFTATAKTNINQEITYEYEYGITAGG